MWRADGAEHPHSALPSNDGDVVTQGDRDVRIATAGSAPATATIERVEDEFGWRIIHIYG